MVNLEVQHADFTAEPSASPDGDFQFVISGIVTGNSPKQHELLDFLFSAKTRVVSGFLGRHADGTLQFALHASADEAEFRKRFKSNGAALVPIMLPADMEPPNSDA